MLMIAAVLLCGCRKADPSLNHRKELACGLVCENAVWDFGEVDATFFPTLSGSFSLKNASQSTIEIGEIKSTCGCLVADEHDTILAPGSEAKLHCTISLPKIPGPIHKMMLVEVNGVQPEQLKLDVLGRCKLNASLYSSPKAVNFGSVVQGKTEERFVTVRRYNGSAVAFDRLVGPDQEGVFASMEQEEEDRVTIRLVFHSSHLTPGGVSTSLKVVTNNDYDPSVEIPIRGVVREPDHGFVSSVVVPRLEMGQEFVCSLSSGTGEKSAVCISSFRYEGDDSLDAELLQLPGDGIRSYGVRLTRNGSPQSGSVISSAICLTIRPGERKIRIPVTVFCPTLAEQGDPEDGPLKSSKPREEM